MSYKGRAGPVEPASVAKVKAPLEEGCVDGLGLRIEFPSPNSESPIEIIERQAPEDRDSQSVTAR